MRIVRFIYPAVGLALLVLLSACNASPAPIKWKEKPALLEGRYEHSGCTQPSQDERLLLEIAVRTIELSEANSPFGALETGARKVLSSASHGRFSEKGFVALCFGRDHYHRVGAALARRGGLGQHRITEYELDLSALLPNPGESIVRDVARVAFSEQPQQSEVFVHEDIRPYARAVLATFGSKASQYGEVAFREMGAATAMATGAAQIATAVGYPGALDRAALLFEQTLESVPNRTVPWQTRNRLYELAWAIAHGGDPARKHTALIRKLMSREVESLAPPFGVIEHAPKQMCLVLERLEGAQALRSFTYCTDDSALER